jgi:ABC-type amino acid transport substrate-binding protein
MADLKRRRAEPASPVQPSRGNWSRSMLRLMRRRGWLRPSRIGCLLVVFVFAVMWLLGRAVDVATDLSHDHPAPVAGSPFDAVTPSRPASSGSPTIDRIALRGKLIVAVRRAAGPAQRSPGSGGDTGFDIALVGLIAQDLGVDPARTSFKPLAASSREGALSRSDVDLVLGYEITPQASASVAGPYLVRRGTTIEYGVGLPPDDPVLHERVTSVLRHAIGDGTWARLYAEYLGTPVPNPPVPR